MKTTTIKWMIWLTLLTSLLSGCTQDDEMGKGALNGVYNIEYIFDDIITKTIATSPEKALLEAYFIFYENGNDDATQTYVAHQRVAITGNATSFPMSIPSTLTPGNKYKVLILGNYDSNMAGSVSFDNYISTLNNISRRYSSHKRDIYAQTTGVLTGTLPFFGILLEVGATSQEETLFTCPDASTTSLGVKVKFARTVSRLDLINNVPAKLDIQWVKVCNYRDRGYFFHNNSLIGGVVKGTDDPQGQVAVTSAGGVQSIRGGIYSYPNIVASTEQGDNVTTYLMIAGHYKGDNPSNTEISYYRANISNEGSPQLLKANHAYTVTINNVTAEGGGTEGEADQETDYRLEYQVSDKWEEDGDDNTAVDPAGNYIIVSKSSLFFDSGKDVSRTVSVKTKNGALWTAVWENNQGAKFTFRVNDDKAVTVVTAYDNNGAYTNDAKLKIYLTAHPEVFVYVSCAQIALGNEIQMLTVNGKLDHTIRTPGVGTSFSLRVMTGGQGATWTASIDNALGNIISTYTQDGAHNGVLNILLLSNGTGRERSGILTVRRVPDQGVPPIDITIVQEASTRVLTVFPNYGAGNPMIIEGFSNERENRNGFVSNHQFWINLADRDNYTWTAEMTGNLNKNADVFITKDHKAQSALYSAYTENSAKLTKIENGTTGQTFWLNVYRTGPGDIPIRGTITIVAIHKTTSSQNHRYAFSFEIVSSCDIGDVPFGTLVLADRDTRHFPKKFMPVALNYSASTDHPDNANNNFMAHPTVAGDVLNPCPGWEHDDGDRGRWSSVRVEHFTQDAGLYAIVSKGRTIILGDSPTNSENQVGCYFQHMANASNNLGAWRQQVSTVDTDKSDGTITCIGQVRSGLINNSSITGITTLSHGSISALSRTSSRCVRAQ